MVKKKHEEVEASHREIILAHSVKVQVKIEVEKTAEQWKEERGEKARQQYYTILKQSKKFKKPTKKNYQQLLNYSKIFQKLER